MKNLKKVLLGIVFAGAMLYTSPAEAKIHHGNYFDGTCLHVYTYHTFLGIRYGYHEFVDCP